MKVWLNSLLNQVSMYRLLSIALSSLVVVALTLATLDLLPHSPIAMLLSAGVLIGAAYASNVLFSWLFDVTPHNESSFITALILFFLFLPTATIGGLAALAHVAMIAMGSKYVLTIRGRHVFNPAAIGVVIAGLLGTAYATWWIATPLLAPATAVFAFLILYKTRRLRLGVVFLSIATILIVSGSITTGQTLSSALTFLLSWPLLFFVGFMLSEPLTLPPKAWQRYLIGSIVALLFAIPFDIGILSSTPALALVVGNAVGFMFTQRRHIQLTFKERIHITPSADEYVFESNRPIIHEAGQYMEITLPHKNKDGRGLRRIFSIVSAPGDTTVRFGIKMYERPSSFKQALRSLQPGAVITGTSIGGDFLLPKDERTPLLFIAGGIGITPFISHLLDIRQKRQKRDITLLYYVTSSTELAYVPVLKEADIRVIVATNDSTSLPIPSWSHHQAERISATDVAAYVPDISQRSAYISGPPEMVDTARQTLKRLGTKNITCDYFTGY